MLAETDWGAIIGQCAILITAIGGVVGTILQTLGKNKAAKQVREKTTEAGEALALVKVFVERIEAAKNEELENDIKDQTTELDLERVLAPIVQAHKNK